MVVGSIVLADGCGRYVVGAVARREIVWLMM